MIEAVVERLMAEIRIPGTHAALTEVGLGREEAAALVTESLTHWARRSRR